MFGEFSLISFNQDHMLRLMSLLSGQLCGYGGLLKSDRILDGGRTEKRLPWDHAQLPRDQNVSSFFSLSHEIS